jgi:hypothetical protein
MYELNGIFIFEGISLFSRHFSLSVLEKFIYRWNIKREFGNCVELGIE